MSLIVAADNSERNAAPPNATPSVSEFLRTTNYSLGVWRNTFLVIWHGITDVPGAQMVYKGMDALVAKNPEGVGLFTIVEEDAPMPSSDARRELAKILKDHGGAMKASAVIFEGQGLRSAAVRSVVTGISMIAQTPYPHKVFSTVREGSMWMAKYLYPEPNSAEQMQASFGDFRTANNKLEFWT